MYNINSHVDLESNLDSPTAKVWLETFNIKMKKESPILARNFSGAAWVKNLCFDGTGEKTWEVSESFKENIKEWHGNEFNWGIKYYRGKSIILWDTLRDFQ